MYIYINSSQNPNLCLVINTKRHYDIPCLHGNHLVNILIYKNFSNKQQIISLLNMFFN